MDCDFLFVSVVPHHFLMTSARVGCRAPATSRGVSQKLLSVGRLERDCSGETALGLAEG